MGEILDDRLLVVTGETGGLAVLQWHVAFVVPPRQQHLECRPVDLHPVGGQARPAISVQRAQESAQERVGRQRRQGSARLQ
jgi:hypothetical protein